MPSPKRLIGSAALFVAGLATGILLQPHIASAQDNRFGPEDVSVPKSFLQGGDRSLALLQDIRGILQDQTALLQQISANTAKKEK